MTKQTVYSIAGGNRDIGFKQINERKNKVVITTARKSEEIKQIN